MKHRINSKQVLRVLPVLIAAAYAGGAAAAEVLEEVVVTAQKREQKLQDVPISITAISGAQLENRGIEGNASLTGLAPNLQVNASPGSSLISQTSIRGSVTGQVAIYVDPSVGMYVDGVYIAKAQGNMFDLLDLERVEVLRGPQGTLFGRNTLGGAVNFVTRKPSGTWSGSVAVDVGNYGRNVERVSLDLPKIGIASIGMGIRNEQADGWLGNANGKAEGGVDRQSFRLAVNLDISPALKVDYSYDYSNINETMSPTTLYSLSGSNGSLTTLGNILKGVPFPAFQNAGNFLIAAAPQMAPYVSQSRPDSIAIDPTAENYQRLRINGNALTVSYAVNDHNTLKYIGSYRNMNYSDRLDLDGTPVQLISTGRNTKLSSYSNEFQWVGNTERLNYAAGLYFYRDDGTTLGGQLIALSPPPANAKYVNYRTTDNAKALYGQIDYKATDALTLTVGARRTSEERGNASAQFASTGYRGPITTTILPWTSASKSWSATTPTIAATYKFNEGLTVYARMARGFRAGGYSAESPNPVLVTTPVDPEKATTYEVGFKSVFADGRAQLNGALFVNKITDMQLSRLPAGTTSSILLNAGKATMEGIELEGVFLVADGWKLQASYGYLHGKFDEYMDYPYNAATAALAGVTTTTLINTAGNRVMPYAPKHTLNLSVDGRLAKTSWGTLRGIMDYTYTAEFYAYPSNISLTAANAGAGTLAGINKMPANGIVNGRLMLTDVPLGGPGTATISLWAKNLFDSKKLSNLIDFGYFQNATWTPPRTYGLSVNYKW
ncbi:MAG: TonB-dependent receptor [Proteobacteria bacterium]|nr:TonB-dependent receptor [Pseudomonadota bacterium]HQR03144.1 TonB-dependent receptor [Rhodocyclaceae bacterium]